MKGGGFTGKTIEEGFVEMGNIPKSQKCNQDGEPDCVWGCKKTKYKYGTDKRKVKDENGRAIILDQKTFYEKDFLYANYEENCNGYKLDKAHFWINYKKFCVEDMMKEAQFKADGQMKRFIMVHGIDEYRKKFNELQEYDYEYDVEDFDDWE